MEILIGLLSVAILGTNAAPQIDVTTPVSIVTQFEANSGDGNFNYSYVASNGINQNVVGFVKRLVLPAYDERGRATGQEQETDIIVQTGSYSYVAPDGTPINVTYVADENGFQPVGDHLPTPPPIPADILSSLQQQAQGDNSLTRKRESGSFPHPAENLRRLNEPAVLSNVDPSDINRSLVSELSVDELKEPNIKNQDNIASDAA